MLSPAEMAARSRELEGLQHRVNALRRDADNLLSIHNGTHPTVG